MLVDVRDAAARPGLSGISQGRRRFVHWMIVHSLKPAETEWHTHITHFLYNGQGSAHKNRSKRYAECKQKGAHAGPDAQGGHTFFSLVMPCCPTATHQDNPPSLHATPLPSRSRKRLQYQPQNASRRKTARLAKWQRLSRQWMPLHVKKPAFGRNGHMHKGFGTMTSWRTPFHSQPSCTANTTSTIHRENGQQGLVVESSRNMVAMWAG